MYSAMLLWERFLQTVGQRLCGVGACQNLIERFSPVASMIKN